MRLPGGMSKRPKSIPPGSALPLVAEARSYPLSASRKGNTEKPLRDAQAA
jgi:hypothetical protein